MFQPNDKKTKGSATAEHLDNAASDFKSAKSELRNAKNSATSELADRAEDKVRDLRASAREAGEKVQHFLHDRQDELMHAKDSAERTIRANPLAAAAGAFLAGAIISRIFKR